MARSRLIIDFNSGDQLAAHVTWLRDSGRFTPETDAVVMKEDEDSLDLCGIRPEFQYVLVPVVREGRGPSVFEATAPPAPESQSEMPPPAHGLAPPTSAAPY
jgi:hypothetical protein